MTRFFAALMVAAALTSAPLRAQTPATSSAPVAVAVPAQFATLVANCEKAKACINGNKSQCGNDATECTHFLDGVSIPMRFACAARKTNKDLPKAMAIRSPKTNIEMIDSIVDYAKANADERPKHKGPATMKAFAKAFPCEN